MPSVKLTHGQLWYAQHRAGRSPYPPVVLIHGATGSHLDWPAELRRLPKTTVLVPDLPGHGRSDGPGREAVSAYAADMVAFLDALEFEGAIFGGHSMGGAIAQTLALHNSQRVAGLILLGTGAKLRVHSDILGNILSDPDQVYDMLVDWMWAEGTPDEQLHLGRRQLATVSPQTAAGNFRACDDFDLMGQIERIDVPTLVIGGTADRMTPLKYSLYLSQQIPRAELVTVEGGGHMMALEQPQFIAEAITSWLERTDFHGNASA
jgi:pimeloyl-ACP methyl ester carboxylesterase